MVRCLVCLSYELIADNFTDIFTWMNLLLLGSSYPLFLPLSVKCVLFSSAGVPGLSLPCANLIKYAHLGAQN